MMSECHTMPNIATRIRKWEISNMQSGSQEIVTCHNLKYTHSACGQGIQKKESIHFINTKSLKAKLSFISKTW